jgi:hypothetical protein
VNRHDVADGRIRGNDDGFASDDVPLARDDPQVRRLVDAGDVRVHVDLSAASTHCVRQARDVAPGIELRLLRIAQAPSGLEGRHRRAIDEVDTHDSGAAGGRGLELQKRQIGGGRGEQVSVDTLEVAFDRFTIDGAFNGIDTGGMAFGGESGALRSVNSLELDITLIEGDGEMGGRSTSLAAPRLSVIQNDDAAAMQKQSVRDRESGNPGADDADIGLRVVIERYEVGPRRKRPG